MATSDTQSPIDFNSLVKDILDNPDVLLESDLTAEQLLEVQKRINPYAGIAGGSGGKGPDVKRVASCSYTNLREDYIRRFTMTSLVGFLFQMVHEWEVPADLRRWTPADRRKPEDPAVQPFDVDQLVARLEEALEIAKEAQAALKATAESHRSACEDSLVLTGKAKKRANSRLLAASEAKAKPAGLLYAATHAAHRLGAEASGRLRSTAEMCMKYPEVKKILNRYPLPPPPGELETPAAVAKTAIEDFLSHWLSFDPSLHVRSGYDAATIDAAVKKVRLDGTGGAEVAVDTKDPGHLPLEAVRAPAPTPAAEHSTAVAEIMRTPAAHSAAVALLRDPDLADAVLTALAAPEAFQHYLLPVPAASPARPAADITPPQDTFHRWSYYTEVNHDALRTITEALYVERPDLDWALALWDVFEGSQKEVDEAFERHCQRYQNEIPSALKCIELGQWTLLANFAANRQKIQFYNKNTEVLKRILDRHAADQRIGEGLMRNRVRQTKARNIAAEGPDAKGLGGYRSFCAERGQDLGAKGVERVIKPEEMKRLERAKGSIKAAQELELLEYTENRIGELEELARYRRGVGKALTEEEQRELAQHQRELPRIREMAAVPDDAIQVDVFTSDPASGSFVKTHFYSKAESPEEIAQARAEAEAAQRRRDPRPVQPPAAPATSPATGLEAFPTITPLAVEKALSADTQKGGDGGGQ